MRSYYRNDPPRCVDQLCATKTCDHDGDADKVLAITHISSLSRNVDWSQNQVKRPVGENRTKQTRYLELML